MASLKYIADASLQTVTLGSAYTAASGTMTLTAGHGARLPSAGDFWIAYNNGAGAVRIFKVTARSTDTLTVTADATEGSGDGSISSGETLRWALTVAALTQLRADIVADGGLVLLESHTASASASLDFTTCITSTHNTYMIVVENLLPATDGANLRVRFSTDGGSSYISTSSYQWMSFLSSGTGNANGGSASDTEIEVSGGNESTTGQWTANAVFYLCNPLSGSVYTNIWGEYTTMDSSGTGIANMYMRKVFGQYKATTAVNAFQFLYSSGNVASGVIRVYGMKK